MAEQVLDIGCNSKSPCLETWADSIVLDLSFACSLSFFGFKRKLLGGDLCSRFPYFVKDYLKQPCIPEIFALSFCELTKREDIKKLATTLEAFQTYSVSLYDQIDDNHLIGDNEPTILKRYGIISTNYLKRKCEHIYLNLSSELERVIPFAQKISRELLK